MSKIKEEMREKRNQDERHERYKNLITKIESLIEVEIKEMETSNLKTYRAHKNVLELLKSSCETSIDALSSLDPVFEDDRF